MEYIFRFFIGILIGFGAILPGVSSGVFCVIFGLYEKLVNSILNFFKDIKKNFLFLFPIGAGAIIGIILFGNIIKYIFLNYTNFSCFSFIGLILGTIPSLFKQAVPQGYIKFKNFIFFILAFILGILFIVLEKHNIINFSISNNFIYLVFAGLIMSTGIVVPGISNTILLMCLGVYSTYIEAIASLNLNILIPLGIGLILGSFIWLKTINLLLEKHHSSTFFSIIGFTLGSIFVLYPGFTFDVNGIISILLCVFCICFSYKLSNLKSEVGSRRSEVRLLFSDFCLLFSAL